MSAPGFAKVMADDFKKAGEHGKRFKVENANFDIGHGDVVIAAITSCTNTSNPSVMIGAGPAGAQRRQGGPHARSRG